VRSMNLPRPDQAATLRPLCSLLRFVFAFTASLPVFACGDADGQKRTVANQGSVCATKDGGARACEDPVSLQSGQVLQLSVDLGVCLSSSCDQARSASCSAVRSGSVIEVIAEGSWTDNSANADGCTLDCGFLGATCETEALPDGNYEIRYAGNTLPISIPSSKFRVCTSGSAWFSNCCDTNADCGGKRCNNHVCSEE